MKRITKNPVTTNRVINWTIRDTELSLRSSGYRGNLSATLIDRKPINKSKS